MTSSSVFLTTWSKTMAWSASGPKTLSKLYVRVGVTDVMEGTTVDSGAVSIEMESPTAPDVETMMGEFSAISLEERPLERTKVS